MSAVAAPLIQGDQVAAPEPTETAPPTEFVADPTEPPEATEPAEEPESNGDQAAEHANEREARARSDAKTAAKAAAKAERDAAKAQRAAAKVTGPKGPKAAKTNNGRGNGHGKAVSSAARGQTPPVGNCRNHGHWVSTVAKGLASCDDNS